MVTNDRLARWSEDIAYLVDDIKADLLTLDQRSWLIRHDLSVLDVLTGHVPADLLADLEVVLFIPWNEVLGERYFGYGVTADELRSSIEESVEGVVFE